MLVTLGILTYNRLDTVTKLLDSVFLLEYQNLEVIVVDNCSNEYSEGTIPNKFGFIKYVRTGKNLGVTARNIIFKEATGDIIITIDDDIFGLTDVDIGAIVNYFSENSNVGALNFKVTDYYSGEICNWIHHKKVEESHDEDFLTYEITEGAVAFRKKSIETSGYYPEYFFLSHEGPDLAFRILDSGYEVRYSPIVSVLHSHAQGGRKSWFRYYYDTRNQFLLAMRNFPLYYLLCYLFKGGLSTCYYSLRDGFFRYWLKGVLDGLCGMVKNSKDRNVLSRETMSILRDIDKCRPSILYMLKKRIFRKEMRL